MLFRSGAGSGWVFDQPELAQICFQFCDGTPWKNGGVFAFIRWNGRRSVGPAAAANQRQQGPLVQPGQMDCGLSARASPHNHDASSSGQGHQKVAGIAHATGQNNSCSPVRWRHLVRWHDAQHQAICQDGAFGGNAGCRAAASTHHGNAQWGQRLARLTGKRIGVRAGQGPLICMELVRGALDPVLAALQPLASEPDAVTSGQRLCGDQDRPRSAGELRVRAGDGCLWRSRTVLGLAMALRTGRNAAT